MRSYTKQFSLVYLYFIGRRFPRLPIVCVSTFYVLIIGCVRARARAHVRLQWKKEMGKKTKENARRQVRTEKKYQRTSNRCLIMKRLKIQLTKHTARTYTRTQTYVLPFPTHTHIHTRAQLAVLLFSQFSTTSTNQTSQFLQNVLRAGLSECKFRCDARA